MSIEEGMKAGYLATIDYRLFVDNLDWDFVRSHSRNNYSLCELNRQLFLPQRDATIVDEPLRAHGNDWYLRARLSS